MNGDLYVREGSKFVLYSPTRQHTPPIPVPVPVDVEPPAGEYTDPANPYRTVLEAARCPHGSFLRWAERNCRPCARVKGRR